MQISDPFLRKYLLTRNTSDSPIPRLEAADVADLRLLAVAGG
jgi:hypothetical protein